MFVTCSMQFHTASRERCGQGYKPCLWRLKLIETVCVRSNCELLSHHAKILYGGWLHGGPHKPQNCQNWRVGPCSGMGACSGMGTCTGQYGTFVLCAHIFTACCHGNQGECGGDGEATPPFHSTGQAGYTGL